MRKNSTELILEWSERIKNKKLSNMSREAWCKEQGISHHTFQYWASKLNKKSSTSSIQSPFLEIQEDHAWIEISLRGVKIAISKDFDKTALLYFLQLLKEK